MKDHEEMWDQLLDLQYRVQRIEKIQQELEITFCNILSRLLTEGLIEDEKKDYQEILDNLIENLTGCKPKNHYNI